MCTYLRVVGIPVVYIPQGVVLLLLYLRVWYSLLLYFRVRYLSPLLIPG